MSRPPLEYTIALCSTVQYSTVTAVVHSGRPCLSSCHTKLRESTIIVNTIILYVNVNVNTTVLYYTATTQPTSTSTINRVLIQLYEVSFGAHIRYVPGTCSVFFIATPSLLNVWTAHGPEGASGPCLGVLSRMGFRVPAAPRLSLDIRCLFTLPPCPRRQSKMKKYVSYRVSNPEFAPAGTLLPPVQLQVPGCSARRV